MSEKNTKRNVEILLPMFWGVFVRFYLFIFRESGKEGEREGEKH